MQVGHHFRLSPSAHPHLFFLLLALVASFISSQGSFWIAHFAIKHQTKYEYRLGAPWLAMSIPFIACGLMSASLAKRKCLRGSFLLFGMAIIVLTSFSLNECLLDKNLFSEDEICHSGMGFGASDVASFRRLTMPLGTFPILLGFLVAQWALQKNHDWRVARNWKPESELGEVTR